MEVAAPPVSPIDPALAARRVAVRNPRGRAARREPGERALTELAEQTEAGVGSNVTLAAVVVSTIATILIGAYGMRVARTTSDFFVASRTVRPMWNASAISGEYLSAASFLGVAGLVMKYGVDMLWYPVGFAAGYLILLLLVAAPLRRFGAYTIPDFAEGRLDSLAVRRLATTV